MIRRPNFILMTLYENLGMIGKIQTIRTPAYDMICFCTHHFRDL